MAENGYLSSKSIRARLWLYFWISVLGVAGANLLDTDFSNAKSVASFVISCLLAGLITVRSFVDKSNAQLDPNEVKPEPPAPAINQ